MVYPRKSVTAPLQVAILLVIGIWEDAQADPTVYYIM